MFTVSNNESIMIVNKSKFIANIFSVDNIDEVNEHLKFIRNKYKDATHHCYAFIIDNNKRFNDDNEPNGTAGKPILECLEKNNLNHVLCIITRYFGGIKLGASNLLRAYSNSASNAILNTNKLKILNGYDISITFDYDKVNDINKILENCIIKNKIFDKDIKYDVLVDCDTFDILKNIVNVEIKKEIIIKR